jgi:predicted TIM-barrel fold metal-dependent hydrolase
MHMGYPFLQETKAILSIYPQVYTDMAVIDWALPKEEFYQYLKSMITAGFEKRIMYGSDQMIWDDAIGMSIKTVEAAPFLSEQQKQDLFYNNAAKFYGIK